MTKKEWQWFGRPNSDGSLIFHMWKFYVACPTHYRVDCTMMLLKQIDLSPLEFSLLSAEQQEEALASGAACLREKEKTAY